MNRNCLNADLFSAYSTLLTYLQEVDIRFRDEIKSSAHQFSFKRSFIVFKVPINLDLIEPIV